MTLGQAVRMALNRVNPPQYLRSATPPGPGFIDAEALRMRDRQRRLAARASNTIRTGPMGAPFNPQAKSLLGS